MFPLLLSHLNSKKTMKISAWSYSSVLFLLVCIEFFNVESQ